MAAHNELGREGEETAVSYLMGKGYIIRDRNWKLNHLELDIVAVKDDQLVVVEVKTRSNTLFMEPEEAVNRTKMRRIVLAANAYIRRYRIDLPVRFDIVTVVGKEQPFTINHIEEAFCPPLF
ncbi:MAG: YraN family protein [Prevotellaceae bacterium]|jgi:putative endonuclease|nr:YraN family protein [Prevotellaceae bacterium]